MTCTERYNLLDHRKNDSTLEVKKKSVQYKQK